MLLALFSLFKMGITLLFMTHWDNAEVALLMLAVSNAN